MSAASVTQFHLRDNLRPRLRKPWEVIDEEIFPHLTLDIAFGDLDQLKPDGRFWQACCPIHEGKEAGAFSVDPDRLEWICFLGCGGGGPVQFIQKAQSLSWMEAAQALAVMAGIDPGQLQVWGSHWTEKDFERHDRLELRSSLLRLFMALTRSLLFSEAGRSLRRYLGRRYQISESNLADLNLGLYTNPADIYHFLKKTGQDLQELRRHGLFDAGWSGRLVAPWKDLSGRTVNLWSWDPGNMLAEGHQATGVLFPRDSLGAQRAPFQLQMAVEQGKRDVLLLEDPLQAVIPGCLGLRDPFPVASLGGLTMEHVDMLERALAEDGTLTLLTNYRPDTYGGRTDSAARNLKLLEEVSFPVFLVDSKLLANGGRKQPSTPDHFIRENGFGEFCELLKQCEVVITPEDAATIEPDSYWPGWFKAFGGLGRKGRRRSREVRVGQAEVDQSELASGLPVLGAILAAAEEIGHRIARGFLKTMPGGQVGAHPALSPLAEGAVPPLLPVQVGEPEPPPAFSVDRLVQESLSSSQAKASGWNALDRLGVRFRPGELTILGGGAGHGRSSLLVGLLVNWLRQRQEAFVFCSFDESEVQIFHRLLSLLTALDGCGWSIPEIQSHFSHSSDNGPVSETAAAGPRQDVLERARQTLRSWEDRLTVIYRPAWNLSNIDRFLRNKSSDQKLGGIMIDPFDHIARDPLGTASASHLPGARWLKSLAVELGCPVVTSLRAEATEGKKPDFPPQPAGEPSDPEVRWMINRHRPTLQVFDQGVSQEADLILGLVSHGVILRTILNGPLPEEAPLEIGILKNRSGPVGEWTKLAFEGRFCRLKDSEGKGEGRSEE